MSLRRRGDVNPKLHMDRQPTSTRITDPSLPAGKRREIDNVMKKARANNTNNYWDKKLIEAEEKDPNRWRHSGYKKMYIQGESSSSDSDRNAGFRYNAGPGMNGPMGPSKSIRCRRSRSRSNSRLRKSPPLSPGPSRSRRSPPSTYDRRFSPTMLESAVRGRPRSPPIRGGRPRSPPERLSRSPNNYNTYRRSPGPGPGHASISRRSPVLVDKRSGQILPRSKRPPSPPPRRLRSRSRSNSSASSSCDGSCSQCSRNHVQRSRSRSHSLKAQRNIPGGPRSPPGKSRPHYRDGTQIAQAEAEARAKPHHSLTLTARASNLSTDRKLAERPTKSMRLRRNSSPPEDPRLKVRPPEPPEPAAPSSSSANPNYKKKKSKAKELRTRTRIKIEGEKRKKPNTSSDSEESGGTDSDTALPTFTSTTRMTLSERFGKMAQWSLDRSNMENMRITKDSTGGALKVMIEEGLQTPPRRYAYSPAPAGHFPEELATAAPTGILSWDDVCVRYEYYKSRGYLRDLDLKDYMKWEEWWYKYQDWLKQERFYEYWDRQQLRNRRKKLSVAQRLN